MIATTIDVTIIVAYCMASMPAVAHKLNNITVLIHFIANVSPFKYI
jgi:hypothetical protein